MGEVIDLKPVAYAFGTVGSGAGIDANAFAQAEKSIRKAKEKSYENGSEEEVECENGNLPHRLEASTFIRPTQQRGYSKFLQPFEGDTVLDVIVGESGIDFEQMIKGLEGFEYVWVIYWMGQAHRHLKQVRPPSLPVAYSGKIGALATRAPHRPNPIGMSCVRLVKIQGRCLWVSRGDWFHGTPVLDLKPYIDEVDGRRSSKQGWVDSRRVARKVSWAEDVLQVIERFRKAQLWDLDLAVCEQRLAREYEPTKSNRLRKIHCASLKREFLHWTWLVGSVEQGALITHVQSWGRWRLGLEIPEEILEPIQVRAIAIDLQGLDQHQASCYEALV